MEVKKLDGILKERLPLMFPESEISQETPQCPVYSCIFTISVEREITHRELWKRVQDAIRNGDKGIPIVPNDATQLRNESTDLQSLEISARIGHEYDSSLIFVRGVPDHPSTFKITTIYKPVFAG